MKDFNKIFKEWGQAQYEVPAHNADLKAKIMAEFEVMPKKSAKTFSFPYPAFAVSALALLLIIVLVYKNNPHQQNTYTAASLPLAPTALSLGSGSSRLDDLNTDKKDDNSLNELQNERSSSGAMNKMSLTYGDYPAAAPANLSDTYHSQAPTIKDSREFLKISYSSTIQALNVESTTASIKTSLNGFDGRVDSYSEDSQDSYFNFVIPQNHFEAFKQQVKNIAGSKFYLENVQATNLLSQKQGIEQNTKTTQDSLKDLQNQQAQVTTSHNQEIARLNSQVAAKNNQLQAVQAELKINSMNADLQTQAQTLINQITSLKNNIAGENYSYQDDTRYYNFQIQDAQDKLKNLSQQNSDLVDDVATVSGSIRVYHVSWYEYINIYFPFYFSIPIVFILIFAWVVFRKRSVEM